MTTRQQKIKILKDLYTGKVPLESIQEPKEGTLFILRGNVYAHQTKGKVIHVNNVPADEYRQQINHRHSHEVIFEKYSL